MQIADTDNVCEEYYLSDKATTALTPMPSQSAGGCRWRMNYQEWYSNECWTIGPWKPPC